ncbi:MAG: hypothetical protein ABIX01_04475 [Chitinophagaceae bacterium]
MKKVKIISTLLITIFVVACFNKKAAMDKETSNDLVSVPAQQQYPGNAEIGYRYLVEGDYLKSGIPFSFFKMSGMKEKENYLKRTGVNATTPFNYTVVNSPNGEQVVSPNCLYCHAQKFGDSLVIGLGNSLSDYTMPQDATMGILEMAVRAAGPKKKEASMALIRAAKASNPYLVAESKGVNVADRLTAILAAHRNPATFQWIEKEQLDIPPDLIPTDVPAWWLLKKKNAMFYSGFGRGDFPRFLMASNLLTVSDTAESAEVLTHFSDVLAYLYSLKAPKFPKPVNEQLALQGKAVFTENCSRCHGEYGDKPSYPNLLVPSHIIKTDSMLVLSNYSTPTFLQWFKKSWFTTGERPADLVPFKGYIAPPLDGVWCTAPYLHNASVPNLETLLNSKLRPIYWSRNFDRQEYDYDKVGWKYEQKDKQYTKSTYNTTLKGYSNSGHYFGDQLSDTDRNAVIEYLKTL